MPTSSPQDAGEATPTATEGLPDWWPPFAEPTIPWRDDEEGRRSALSVGTEHDRLLEAYRALGERHGGGFMAMLYGMLAEYARRRLVSERDAERLSAMLHALQQSDPEEAIETVLRLHEEAAADPDAKPAALAVSSITAASMVRARANVAVNTGSGLVYDVIHAAADAGGQSLLSLMGCRSRSPRPRPHPLSLIYITYTSRFRSGDTVADVRAAKRETPPERNS